MAILKTASKQHPLEILHSELTKTARRNSDVASYISTEAIDLVTAGKESTAAHSDIATLAQTLEDIFVTSMESHNGVEARKLGFSGKLTDAQRDAVSIMAVALSEPKKYHEAAMNISVESANAVAVVDASTNPAFGYTDGSHVSLEAFDARNLENLRGFNLMFAFSAAIQDEFGETFFRTVTLSPDNAGLEVSIRRTMIQEEIRHQLTGEFIDWRQRNLLDAVTDPSIIINNTTEIFPRVIVGDKKSEANFADAAKIAPQEILANGGAKVVSAPLRPGKTIDLIGLSHNDKIPGQSDQTDSLDHSIVVSELYFEITTASGKSIVKFDTAGLARSNFLKAQQGRDRAVNLSFDVQDLTISGNTTDITGAPAAALAFLNTPPFDHTQVKLGAYISGTGNLQFGTIQVNGSPAAVKSARNVNPVDGTYENIVDQTTLDTLNDAFKSIELVGYKVKARRSNLNRRQLGLLIDSVEERVRYVVPLSSPISVQTPITDTPTATELAAPLTAQRLLNSINAVTKVLEVRDTLRSVKAQIGYRSPTDPAPEIEGFARVVVRPYLFDDVINVADVVTNTSSARRTADVMAVLTNKIRFAVTAAYTESRYQPALDAINGTSGERPTVVIGTDPVTASYLAVEGDWRTIIGFDAKVVVSYDVRMRNKIACSFVRPAVNDVDIMSFGAMAYVPELVTNAMIQYNGAATQVTQVQNRTLHVCFLPVLVWLEVEGLEEATSKEVSFGVSL